MHHTTKFAEYLDKYANTQDGERKDEHSHMSQKFVTQATSLFEHLGKSLQSGSEELKQLHRLQGLNLITWSSCIASSANLLEATHPEEAQVSLFVVIGVPPFPVAHCWLPFVRNSIFRGSRNWRRQRIWLSTWKLRF